MALDRTGVFVRRHYQADARAGGGRFVLMASLACLVALGFPTASPASPGAFEATSDNVAKKEAKRAIPWSQLARKDSRVVQYVVSKPSLYRRMPTRVVECDPEMFNFLARRPEVVVNVWNLMGVSKLTLNRKSETLFHASDNFKTEGAMRVLSADWRPDCHNRIVLYVDGYYHQPPLLQPIRAKCVLLLRTGSAIESNGKTYVTARLDSFIRFDRVGADLVAKTLRPLLTKTADHNFVETMNFVSTFSATAQRNPTGMQHLAQRLDKTDLAARNELAAISRRAAERYANLLTIRANEKIRLTQLEEKTAAKPN